MGDDGVEMAPKPKKVRHKACFTFCFDGVCNSSTPTNARTLRKAAPKLVGERN